MENVVGAVLILYIFGGLLSIVRALVIYSGEKESSDINKVAAGLFLILLLWPLEFNKLWLD